MDNDANTGNIDGQDENLRDRNVTDSGSRLGDSKTRSERGSIDSEVNSNRDTNTQTEDIDSRSNLGVGE